MAEFAGFVSLNDTIRLPVLTANASGIPVDADSLPYLRIYSAAGLMPGSTGSAVFKDAKAITAAANQNPILITSAGHSLQTGMKATISGVLGNTAANGTWQATRIDANTFSIPASGNGEYTGGGTWHLTGLYDVVVTPTEAAGFASGAFYDVVAISLISALPHSQAFRFGVA